MSDTERDDDGGADSGPTSSEKRAFSRYSLWFPVTINVVNPKDLIAAAAGDAAETREVWAVCQDASAGGILISGSSQLAVGDIVTVSFRASIDDPDERKISGRIVRVERTDDDPRSVWPHRMAIEFVEPVVELQGLFKRVSSRPPPPPSGPSSSPSPPSSAKR